VLTASVSAGSSPVAANFDRLYGEDERYWWRHENPYSTNPDDFPHSLLTQITLRMLADRPVGRALDLGAGEGADSIRLARLGYDVTAVDISPVGASKVERFAADADVKVTVEVADVSSYVPSGLFDVVTANGLLHYVANKELVVERMQRATTPGGINVVSLWSTYTRVPACHQRVPVYCDDENGVVTRSYGSWVTKLLFFERNKTESAHPGMPAHSHSHIKLIAQKPC
jgi:SAM-dependent methyltransferase